MLGELHDAYDVGEEGVVILGQSGMLVAGSNANDYEELMIVYLSLLCREMFIRNFFVRMGMKRSLEAFEVSTPALAFSWNLCEPLRALESETTGG